MKKINAIINQKDRIVCEAIPGTLVFYYQPVGTKARIELFKTDSFSPSVLKYFRKHGRNMNDRGFSITIRQFYEFKDFYNPKLTDIMKRIPGHIEYVIREQIAPAKQALPAVRFVAQKSTRPVADCDCAA